MKNTLVRSLFSNLENMCPVSLYDDKRPFQDCYKLKSLIWKNGNGKTNRDFEKIFTCDDVKGEGKRLIKIMPKKYTSPNNMRKVEVASEAYHNFVANDIDGVQQLVDYLESTNYVFFVYATEAGRTINLQRLIQTKYGSTLCHKNDYGRTMLDIFYKITTTVIELYNHGITHNNLTSENILINMKTLTPTITNFKNASKVQEDSWQKITEGLGALLYEMWIGQSPAFVAGEVFECGYLNHPDAHVNDAIKLFISKTLSSPSLSKEEFYALFKSLP
jgi:serine/threonine protein kinase